MVVSGSHLLECYANSATEKGFITNQAVIFLGSSLIPHSQIIHSSFIQVTSNFLFEGYLGYSTMPLETALT